jgi:hypothetical protein
MRTIGIWGLREEARKSWDYVISDKIIYLSQAPDFNLECPRFTEKYFSRDLWFEVHFTCPCITERESHFQMIWEMANISTECAPVGSAEISGNIVVGAGRAPMFVERPEFIQLPEGVIPKRISSEIRLKRVENACHCGWKQTAPSIVGPWITETGEADKPLFVRCENAIGVEMGEPPCELIESGPQAANEISKKHRNDFRCGCKFNPKDMERFFKICLFDNGVGFSAPSVKLPFKSLEMFIRPAGLHLHEHQPISNGQHVSSLAECDTIGA